MFKLLSAKNEWPAWHQPVDVVSIADAQHHHGEGLLARKFTITELLF
jgi:hypothetical protein